MGNGHRKPVGERWAYAVALTYFGHVAARVRRRNRPRIAARFSAAPGWRPAPIVPSNSPVLGVFRFVSGTFRRPSAGPPFFRALISFALSSARVTPRSANRPGVQRLSFPATCVSSLLYCFRFLVFIIFFCFSFFFFSFFSSRYKQNPSGHDARTRFRPIVRHRSSQFDRCSPPPPPPHVNRVLSVTRYHNDDDFAVHESTVVTTYHYCYCAVRKCYVNLIL